MKYDFKSIELQIRKFSEIENIRYIVLIGEKGKTRNLLLDDEEGDYEEDNY